jgi:hypothetical protein
MAGRGLSLARTSDRRESGRGVLDIRPDWPCSVALERHLIIATAVPPAKRKASFQYYREAGTS